MRMLFIFLFLGSICFCCLDANYEAELAVGADINSLDQCSLNTELMNAIQVGDLETVKALVAYGADVNAIMEKPESSIKIRPILLAIRKPEILEFLLSEGADINAHFGGRQTLLHIAAQSGDTYVTLCLLLQYGADANVVDLYGVTPLHRCMHIKQNALVLMEYGANIHTCDHQGWKPLHRGYQIRDIDLLRKLIELGGSLDEFTPDGKNALHYACGMGTQSNNLIKAKKMELLRFLIEEQKMSVNKHSNWWDGKTGDCTPFMLAIASGGNFADEDFHELEYLLAHGADMNTQIFHVTLGGIRYVLHDSVLAWANGCKLPYHVLLWLKGVA
jgi:ankyrin repeat protein